MFSTIFSFDSLFRKEAPLYIIRMKNTKNDIFAIDYAKTPQNVA